MITHPHDDIEAYVLGTLDEAQARGVLEHAESCPTCAVLLADAMSTMHTMMGPQPERAVRPLRQLQHLLKPELFRLAPGVSTRTSRVQPLSWSVALAALAACFGLLLWNAQLRSHTMTAPIAALVHSHFTHHPLHGSGGTSGNAKVIEAVDGRWLYVVADGLAPQASYRLSEMIAGQKRLVGTFQSTDSGTAAAYWEQPPAKISGFILSQAQDTSSKHELRWP